MRVVEMKEAIAQRIRDLRKAAGLSQQQVADALGVDRSAYTYFENGPVDVKLDRLIQLSDIFSVSLDQLLPQEQFKAIDSGKAESAAINDGDFSINSMEEKSLLLLFRQLDAQTQADLLNALQNQFQK